MSFSARVGASLILCLGLSGCLADRATPAELAASVDAGVTHDTASLDTASLDTASLDTASLDTGVVSDVSSRGADATSSDDAGIGDVVVDALGQDAEVDTAGADDAGIAPDTGPAGDCATLKCDDANPCTTNDCKQGVCVYSPVSDKPCDDANPCTIADTCEDGGCMAGAVKSCDDGEVCTNDTCDAKAGCVHAANEELCDDGDACTKTDLCKNGKCQPGADSCPCKGDDACAKLNSACVTGSCEAGKCAKKPVTGSCDDGDACTSGDVCAAGVCSGKAKDCGSFDGPCAKGQCAAGICAAKQLSGVCDDGDACTGDDGCLGGVCKGKAKDCGSLKDKCNDAACKAGNCVAVPLKLCDDGNSCTTDSCDGAKGCASIPAADGVVCAGGKCAAGVCKAVAVWPFGKDGDLVFKAPNIVTLDADSRDPPIWDFAKCEIGGTLRIIGERSWVFIGCAGDAIIAGKIDMEAYYDPAKYAHGKQPDAVGKLIGAPLVHVQAPPVGGSGKGTVSGKGCQGGGVQKAGNGGGGAGGASYISSSSLIWSCGKPGGSSYQAGGDGGEGAQACGVFGGKGGLVFGANGSPGVAAGLCPGKHCGGGGGGGGMRGESRTNLFLQVAGSLSGAGTIRLLGGSGGGGGNGGDGCSNPSYGAAYGGSPGGGGGGGAGGKLVVRAYSSGGFNFAKQTLLAGGKGGKQGVRGLPFQSAAGSSAHDGLPGPGGSVEFAYLASVGHAGGTCVGGDFCAGNFTCAAVGVGGMCTQVSCTPGTLTISKAPPPVVRACI